MVRLGGMGVNRSLDPITQVAWFNPIGEAPCTGISATGFGASLAHVGATTGLLSTAGRRNRR